ncbi:MAG: hypothetical protein KDB14_16610, partial [Planctomycetales bacterium]|nr:hypothetical protein [Planctomycetales bacterium]
MSLKQTKRAKFRQWVRAMIASASLGLLATTPAAAQLGGIGGAIGGAAKGVGGAVGGVTQGIGGVGGNLPNPGRIGVPNLPGVNTPNVPSLQTPGLNVPSVKTPGLNVPSLKTPGINVPNIPGVNTPDVNLPARPLSLASNVLAGAESVGMNVAQNAGKLVVDTVGNGSLASKLGFQVGDRILAINKNWVTSPDQLTSQLSTALKSTNQAWVYVERNGKA